MSAARYDGPRQWRNTITMTFRETPKETAVALALRLRVLPQPFRDHGLGLVNLDDMIEWLDELDEASTADDIDAILQEIYDWADEHRLWLHLTHPPKDP